MDVLNLSVVRRRAGGIVARLAGGQAPTRIMMSMMA
jgi:hypothetical protein